MDVLTNILAVFSLLLPILLIAGLIKPKWILIWSERPTRWKIFGWWILIVFIDLLTFGCIVQHIESKQTSLDIINAVREGQYSSTYEYNRIIDKLNKIKQEDSLYFEAQILISKADNLRPLSKNEIKDMLVFYRFSFNFSLKLMRPFLIIITDEEGKVSFVEHSENKVINKQEFENINSIIYVKSRYETGKSYRNRNMTARIDVYGVHFTLYDMVNKSYRDNFVRPIIPDTKFPEKISHSYNRTVKRKEIIERINAYIKQNESNNLE